MRYVRCGGNGGGGGGGPDWPSSSSSLLYVSTLQTQLASILINQMKNQRFPGTAQYTDGDLAVSASTTALSFVAIPIYELVIYPIVQSCIGQLTILRRIGIGVGLGVVTQALFLALYEIIFLKTPPDQNYCFLSNSTSALNATIPSPVIAVPLSFSTIAELLVYISGKCISMLIISIDHW